MTGFIVFFGIVTIALGYGIWRLFVNKKNWFFKGIAIASFLFSAFCLFAFSIYDEDSTTQVRGESSLSSQSKEVEETTVSSSKKPELTEVEKEEKRKQEEEAAAKAKAEAEEKAKKEEEAAARAKTEAEERAKKEEEAAARAKAEEEEKAKKEEEERIAKEEEEKRQAAAQAEAEKNKYETGITYDNIARNPDSNIGKNVKFYGEIIQVIKGEDYSQFRFAIDGNYDQLILIEISEDQLQDNRILEDDYITIKGMSMGEMTYTSAIGGEITVPAVLVDSFEF